MKSLEIKENQFKSMKIICKSKQIGANQLQINANHLQIITNQRKSAATQRKSSNIRDRGYVNMTSSEEGIPSQSRIVNAKTKTYEGTSNFMAEPSTNKHL